MRRLLIILTLVVTTSLAFSQKSVFRSGIFLHHSTGLCIWGPNGSTTSVPKCLVEYNAQHGYSGNDSVSMVERLWPSVSLDNEWATWDKIFMDTGTDDIRPILAAYHIIVIKSCFPSSSMTGVGGPADTLNPTSKTMYNYKWHWRRIVNVMKAHPNNFFAIWTNAPLVDNPLQAAALSEKFCRWAKDTLALGLDTFGRFPKNIYVFDFFHKVAGSDGRLKLKYAMSPSNSHPDSLATEFVAPQFVKEIVNAAIAYEQTMSVESHSGEIPRSFALHQNYPNPFNPSTTIRYELARSSHVFLKVYNALGQEVSTLVDDNKPAGAYTAQFDGSGHASGVYFYRVSAVPTAKQDIVATDGRDGQAGVYVATKKLLLLK